MKKLFFALLLMAGVLLPHSVVAQGGHQIVTVGTGTSEDNTAPFNNWYKNSTTEMIYTATEIGTVGTIDTIWFYSTSTNSLACSSLKVYMGTTTNSSFATTTSWVLPSDLEEVYDAGGTITIGGATGWYAIPLQTPYSYAGDNLVVVVTKKASSYDNSLKWQYTSTSNTVLYRRNDSDATYGDLSSLTSSTTGTQSSSRPNIKISISPDVSGCPRVSHASVDSIGENMAVITWQNPTPGEQTLQHVLLEYKANESSTWTSYEVEDDTTYTLTGLQEGTSYTVRLTAICDIDSSSVAQLTFETHTCGEYAGGTTNNSYVPFNGNYNYGYSQAIYPANGLSGVTIITGISFYVASVPTNYTTRTVTIALGNTTQSTLSTSNYVAYSSMTEVATSVPMDVSQTGWVYIPFTTPFAYDGTSNVVVAVSNLTGSYSSFSFKHHATTLGNAVYWYQDSSPISPTSPSASSNGTTTTVPDVRFEANCGGGTSICIRPMNFNVTDLTYNSATLSWTGCEDAVSHQICYGTTNDLAAYQSSASAVYDVTYYFDNLEDSTTYYVWVRSLCNDDTTAWAAFSFTTQVACARLLNASVDSLTENMAIVSWDVDTMGQTLQHVLVQYKADDASVWSTDSVTSSINTYTITGLTAGTTYSVRLISICEFDTSSVVSLTLNTPTCGEYADGTTTNSSVPYNGNYNYGYSQSIYPAAGLSGVTTISGISFHIATTPNSYTTRTVTIALGNTTQTSVSTSSYIPYASMTEVATNVSMDVSQTGWVYIPFTTPFAYDGTSNVVVAVQNLTGSYSSFSFTHHATTLGNAVYWYQDSSPISPTSPSATSSGTTTTVPDVRFDADCGGGSGSGCDRPMNLSVDQFSYNTVDLSWTPTTADSYEVRYGTTTSVTDSTAVTVNASSDIFTLTGLRNNTTYYIWVRGVCGEETSGWSAPVSVTTQLACATLLNAHIDDTSQTYITLSWEVDTSVGHPLTQVVVQWRALGDTVWSSAVVTGINAHVITGLRSGVSYELTLTSVCGTDSSSAVSMSFTTPACHEYTGGTATNGNVPFNGGWNYGYSQTIYPGTALAGVDTIHGISFLTTSAPSSYTTRQVSVYMGNTSLNSVSTSNYVNALAMTLVVDNYPMDVSTPGWCYIPFYTPFIYDGTSNVVVAVVNGTGSYSSFSFSHHSTSVGNSVYWYQDSGPISPSSPSASYNNTTTTVPDIRFDAPCDFAGCAAPVLVVNHIGSTDIQITWIPIGDETEWVVGYKTGSNDWTYNSTTATSYVFSGLIPETEYALQVGAVCDGDTVFRTGSVTTLNGTISLCYPVYGLTAAATSSSEINVSWTPLGSETQWQVHVYNDVTDSSFIATTSSCHVEGLDTATEYLVEVRAVCGEGDSSDWCSPVSVTTEEAIFECRAPVQLTVIAATDSSFVLTWTPQGSETKWQVRVYNVSFDSLYRAYSPNVVVGGLAAQTSYNVRTRAICSAGDTSDWSASTTYSTSTVGIDEAVEDAKVLIYPNPATHTASVDVSGISGRVTITVLDLSGRVLRNEQMECEATCVKTLQVEGLAPGAYFVRVASDAYCAVRKLFVE